MLHRVRRFLDIRPGEGLPVALTFIYIWVVVASFLLARTIRTGLFLSDHEAQALVYVYAAVPLALTIFVPVYTRVAARFGSRTVNVATLVFFSANVVLFWYAFRVFRFELLPGIFYVWVSCYGVIAPVQAWSFASSLFDTRQAKRLFGLVGSGASLGAITGGALARYLVGPVGGAVNLMVVLAALLLFAAAIVTLAVLRVRRPGPARGSKPPPQPLSATWREILSVPYLRTIAGLAFVLAVATQWTGFQLGLVAKAYFQRAEELTRFYGTFNIALGALSFLLQLLLTGRLLRKWGVAATILILPVALATGNLLILALPAFWSVLLTNGLDYGLRFSIDKPSYELLYLPIAPARRLQVKHVIDIVVTRLADGIGAVLLGMATGGFLMLEGLQLGVRGIAALTLVIVAIWVALACRVRAEYIRTIQDSIHRHRLDTERGEAAVTERSAAEVLGAKLTAADEGEVRYALDLIDGHRSRKWHAALRELLAHPAPDIRRRALAILSADGDDKVADRVPQMLRDPDMGVRTEALLYLSRESAIDPLRQIEELGDFEDFSIRAGAVAFLSARGRSRNLDAARLMLEAMATSAGPDGRRDRIEAARLIGTIREAAFLDLLPRLVEDSDPDVARQALLSARLCASETLVPSLITALGRAELSDEAADALAHLGEPVVPGIAAALRDEKLPSEVRRELPSVLLRIGTAGAEAALVASLLESDGTVRHRIIASLNKLKTARPDIAIDPGVVELLLAAEIAGHYRSYQVLGPLRSQLKREDPVLAALEESMEGEIERIFRLMALLFPEAGLHDAYVGLRSSNPVVRANALEFLDTVLKPELRQVLVPLLDAHVTTEERIQLANRLVGAPLETPQQAVATLLASDDPWLRSCAIGAVGTLQIRELAPEIEKHATAADPLVRQSVAAARARLAEEARSTEEPQPAPPHLETSVGAG